MVKFCATHLAVFVNDNRVDKRRLQGEDTLNADIVAHLANGETFLSAFAGDFDHNAAILLDTLFVTLFDAVSDCDGVAGAELGMLFAGGKCLFGYLD